MNKLFFSILFLSLLSCSVNDELRDDQKQNSLDKENSSSLKNTTSDKGVNKKISTDKALLSNKIYTSKEEMVNDYISIYKKEPVLHGPYTWSIRKPTYSTRPGGNQPFTQTISYSSPYSYPPVGIYVAEIYNYKAQILLPNEAVTGYVESVDVSGYSNYTTQTVGINQFTTVGLPADGPFGPITTGLYLHANTYGVILKYNSVGQLINYPIGITDTKTFTYYYVTP